MYLQCPFPEPIRVKFLHVAYDISVSIAAGAAAFSEVSETGATE
jgi:hypothetical protein